jgi:hypothetical protein
LEPIYLPAVHSCSRHVARRSEVTLIYTPQVPVVSRSGDRVPTSLRVERACFGGSGYSEPRAVRDQGKRGSHLIDLLLYLVEEQIESCRLQIREQSPLGMETNALASFRFRSGLRATVFASWQVPLHNNIIQVYRNHYVLQLEHFRDCIAVK